MKGKEKQMLWGAPVLFRWTQTHPTPFGEWTTKYRLPLFPIRDMQLFSLTSWRVFRTHRALKWLNLYPFLETKEQIKQGILCFWCSTPHVEKAPNQARFSYAFPLKKKPRHRLSKTYQKVACFPHGSRTPKESHWKRKTDLVTQCTQPAFFRLDSSFSAHC